MQHTLLCVCVCVCVLKPTQVRLNMYVCMYTYFLLLHTLHTTSSSNFRTSLILPLKFGSLFHSIQHTKPATFFSCSCSVREPLLPYPNLPLHMCVIALFDRCCFTTYRLESHITQLPFLFPTYILHMQLGVFLLVAPSHIMKTSFIYLMVAKQALAFSN